MEHFDVLAARMGTATTWAKAIEPPSATLPQWPFLAKHLGGGVGWVGWVGVVFSLTWSVKVWQSSQRGTGWWKHDFKSEFFQHSHHRQRVYKGGKSHARLLWMLYGNKVILFSTRITVSQNSTYSCSVGSVVSKEKSPCCLECSTVGYQSQKTSCLPWTLGKQSSPDSSAKWFFGRLTPLRIKDIGIQPRGQAGTGPGQDTGIWWSLKCSVFLCIGFWLVYKKVSYPKCKEIGHKLIKSEFFY